MVPGSYLQFSSGGLSEHDGLPVSAACSTTRATSPGGRSRRCGRSRRADFDRILALGFPRISRCCRASARRRRRIRSASARPQAPFVFETERERIAQLTTRIVRDRVFRRVVLDAYDKRCGITGLKLINGGDAPRSPPRTSGRWKQTARHHQQRHRALGHGALDVRPRPHHARGRSDDRDLAACKRS